MNDATANWSISVQAHFCGNHRLCLQNDFSPEQSHRITEVFGLEVNFKDHLVQQICHGQKYLWQIELFKAPSHLNLNTSDVVRYFFETSYVSSLTVIHMVHKPVLITWVHITCGESKTRSSAADTCMVGTFSSSDHNKCSLK